ncbi:TonB-dependent receptor [Blastochloris sulfoviridis]|uniref:TonB-dependent receptor n=1 Tax=Blastochloris sulfoviridis TaxID=50712 RepID=A0A5M6I3A0_9HYPH|nr:TonB-dependent receptor [Blastochloris sulfoviridis]
MGAPLRRSTILLASSLLCSTALTPAYAEPENQSENNTETETIEEITVTARKRTEKLRDIPFSVETISRTELEQKRIIDGTTALRDIAGAVKPTFGDRSNDFIIMRGVGAVTFPLSPDDSSVLTFIDGAPTSLAASNSAYFDLQRVEVLKGPQSTLFGRNTSGGAINLIPVLPSQTPEAYVGVEYGSDNHRQVEGALAGAIVPEKVAGRIAFRARGIDGFIPNTEGSDLGDETSYVGRGSLLFTPNERTRWLVSASGEKTDLSPIYYMQLGDGMEKIAGYSVADENMEFVNLNSKFEYAFDAFTFTAQTSYHKAEVNSRYNALDVHLASAMSGLPTSMFADPATNHIYWTRDESRATQEFRLTSNPGSAISWIAGVVGYQDTANLVQDNKLWLYAPLMAGTQDYTQTTTGAAVFGEITLPLWDKLKWTVGGRLTHESKDFDNLYTSDGTPGTVPSFAEQGTMSYGFWTGRTSLAYEWSPNLSSWVSVARGYKGGGYGMSNHFAAFGIPRDPYDPTSMIAYEIGSRGSFLDNRLNLSGALFYNDVSQEQITAFNTTTLEVLALNVDVQSWGGELEGSYRIAEGWDVGFGAAYTQGELLNVLPVLATLVNGLVDGNKIPNVPEWTLKASLAHRTHVEKLGLGSQLGDAQAYWRLDYSFVDARFADAGNMFLLDSSHYLGARAGLEWEKREFYLFGSNLLNEETISYGNVYAPSAKTGEMLSGVSYARGRTFGLGAKVRL